MAKLVAETYAGALFEVGEEMNTLDSLHEELEGIAGILKSEPSFFEVLRTPKITKEEKKRIVVEVFEGKISLEMLNFLKLIIDKKRGGNLVEIYQSFHSKYRRMHNVVTATVMSVTELTESQKSDLVASLEKSTGKKIEATYKIDEKLLGGVRIQIDDQMIDHTVQKKIHDLRDLLIERVMG